MNIYLRKSTHRWSTLQVCQRREWVLFQVYPHLTTKEHHVGLHSLPTNSLKYWANNNEPPALEAHIQMAHN